MKKLLFLLGAVSSLMQVAAQDSPVRWSSEVNRLEADRYQVVFTAKIEHPWHLYDMGPYEGGPNATTFTFEPAEGLAPDGGVEMLSQPTRVYDEMFGMTIGYFEGTARFAQTLTLSGSGARLRGSVEYMVCNDQNCLPPTEWDFSVEIGTPPAAAPQAPQQIVLPDAPTKGGSIWSAVIEAILWGFAALLTPCVFPMVPMTVSFFMKGEGGAAAGRMKALLYGLFIILLYTLPIAVIILVTNLVGGDAVTADIFNWLATHWVPNVIFFLVFMVFAASFFGAFEITMPSWLVNSSDRKADRGGLAGLFFMALTLVLVSFSCTGPIVGSVLIKSTSGEVWEPVVTMLAFSAAFALPFTLFALFPSLLKNLPKSGGWLNSVKVVLGFIEVALGLKFLSVADQTYHWGLLDREIYLAIWIAVFTLLGFYLLGKLKFAHDSELKHISVTRLLLSIVTFAFVVYLLPGMWGAPLKGLSGYLPPLHTQDFVMGSGQAAAPAPAPNRDAAETKVKYADFLHLPFGLEGFFDFQQGLEQARKVGKPVFVDFTGHGCVNCREMEARVWSDQRVQSILRNDYVIVALYSDDKKVLPESDWVTTESGKVLKSLGKINSHFANTRFGINAQPYYLLLDTRGQLLVPPRGYDLDVEEYIDFLRSGVEKFKAEQR